MNKNSWLIYIYVIVGLVIISSLIYSFDISVKDITNKSVTSTSDKKESSANSYSMKLGQSKTIRGIVYTFNRVLSDTRCDPTMRCEDKGSADVEITIGGLGTSEIVPINTDDLTTYANLNIEILSLTPVPSMDAKDAKLTISVTEVE